MPKVSKETKDTSKKTKDADSGSKGKSTSKSTSKSASKGGDKEKKTRGKQNQSVAFLYGGELLKTNRSVLFTVDSNKPDDVKQYVRDNFSKYYGSDVSGRFIKCEDGDDTLVEVLEAAKEKDYLLEPDSNILKCSVNDAAELLKDVTKLDSTHTFKLGESKKGKGKAAKEDKDDDDDDESPKKGKGKAAAKKGGKKAAKEEESDDEEVEKDDKDSDSDDDDKDKDDSDEDKDESEDEAPKKGKGKPAAKKASKGK